MDGLKRKKKKYKISDYFTLMTFFLHSNINIFINNFVFYLHLQRNNYIHLFYRSSIMLKFIYI